MSPSNTPELKDRRRPWPWHRKRKRQTAGALNVTLKIIYISMAVMMTGCKGWADTAYVYPHAGHAEDPDLATELYYYISYNDGYPAAINWIEDFENGLEHVTVDEAKGIYYLQAGI